MAENQFPSLSPLRDRIYARHDHLDSEQHQNFMFRAVAPI